MMAHAWGFLLGAAASLIGLILAYDFGAEKQVRAGRCRESDAYNSGYDQGYEAGYRAGEPKGWNVK